MDTAAQYAFAYALTTTTGIRALLPLALVSIAAHFGYIHPPTQFSWLGSTNVTVILLAVAAVEMFADKIPLVDHALHFVQIVTKPAAAAILVGGTAHPQSHDALVALMVLGALNALGVHAFTSSVRVASTATTAGIANPLLSAFEDASAILLSVLAFVAPFLAAVLCLIVVVVLFRVGRRALVRANSTFSR
jgi:uncharacterized membrane protein